MQVQYYYQYHHNYKTLTMLSYGDSKMNGLAALGVSKVEEAMKGMGTALAQQETFDLTGF